jgi:hypothetical protein
VRMRLLQTVMQKHSANKGAGLYVLDAVAGCQQALSLDGLEVAQQQRCAQPAAQLRDKLRWKMG